MFSRPQFLYELYLRLKSIEITLQISKTTFDENNKIFQAYVKERDVYKKSGKFLNPPECPKAEYVKLRSAVLRQKHFTNLKLQLIEIRKSIIDGIELSEIKLPQHLSDLPGIKFITGKKSPESYEYDPEYHHKWQSAKPKPPKYYVRHVVDDGKIVKTVKIIGPFNRLLAAEQAAERFRIDKNYTASMTGCKINVLTVDSSVESVKRYDWAEFERGSRGLIEKDRPVWVYHYKDA